MKYAVHAGFGRIARRSPQGGCGLKWLVSVVPGVVGLVTPRKGGCGLKYDDADVTNPLLVTPRKGGAG